MTQVMVKFTGEVWDRMGTGHVDFAFEGATLGALLDCLLTRYNLRDLLFDENGKIRFRSRITVNGRFSDTLGGMETPVHDGDTIVLMRPGLGAS
jgi:molybdopterin converting factor small subunit